MNGKPKRPWHMFAPLGAVIILFLLWSGYWVAANSAAQKQIGLYRSQLANRGFSLGCDDEIWGGYPFRFEFTCETPALTLADGSTLRSHALFAVAQAYDPAHVVALLEGPSEVSLKENESYAISHDRAVIGFEARKDGARISAEISNVKAADIFAAQDIQFHTRPAEPGNDIAITIANAVYRQTSKPPLAIDRAQLLGTLDRQRVLDLTDVQMSHEQVKLWGKGSAHLDAMHRIAGQIQLQTNDLNGLFELIDPHLRISPEDRSTLLTLLGLFGQGASALLLARDGELYLGPVKLGELQPVY